MALLKNNFVGFETGGGDEAAAVAGSPTYPSTETRPESNNCLLLDGAGDEYDVPWTHNVTDAGGSHIITAYLKFDSTTADATGLVQVIDSNADVVLSIELGTALLTVDDAGGTARISSSASSVGTVDYHLIQVYFTNTGTNDSAELLIDGVSEGTTSTADFLGGGSLNSSAVLRFLYDGTNTIRVEDVLIQSGATAASDRVSAWECFGLQHSKGATATPDAGIAGNGANNLNNGTWDLTQNGNDGDSGEYENANTGGSNDLNGPLRFLDGAIHVGSMTGINRPPFGRISTAQSVACSFVTTAADTPQVVRLRLEKVGTPTDNVQISIQADSSGEPSGTDLVIFADLDASTLTTGLEWYDLLQTTTTSLSDATTYWIVYARSGGVDSSNYPIFGAYNDGNGATGAKDFNGSVWSSLTATSDADFFLTAAFVFDGDSNIQAIKGMYRLNRAGGGAAQHLVALGNSGDSDSPAIFDDDTDWPEITTVITNAFIVTETGLPTTLENIRLGFGKAAGAGQDMFMYDSWGFLGHEPDAEGGGPFTGEGALTFSGLTISGDGLEHPSAAGALALAELAIDGTAEQPHEAVGALTFSDLGVAGVGVMQPSAVGALTFDALAVAGSGLQEFIGTGVVTFSSLAVAGVGDMDFAGAGVVTFSELQIAGDGVMEADGVGNVTFASLEVDGAGALGVTGTGILTFDSLAVAGVGVAGEVGSGSLAFETLVIVASGTQVSISIAALVRAVSNVVIIGGSHIR